MMHEPYNVTLKSRQLWSHVAVVAAATVALIIAAAAVPASAQIVYQNDFETNTAGFSVATTVSRTTGNAGLNSAPLSTYLGRFANDTITLTLNGLSAGTVYDLDFDLFIEGTMDGSEPWSLVSSSSSVLVNTTFSNFFNQAYSDTTFTSTTPQDKALFTGADVIGPTNGSNFDRYSIYYFGRGAGNPQLTFTASAASEVLTFSGTGMQDASDESWSLDNVIVRAPGNITAAPEPGTLALFAVSALPLAGVALRRRFRLG